MGVMQWEQKQHYQKPWQHQQKKNNMMPPANDFQISMTEHLERGVSEMCNLSNGIEEKGFQQGIEQGTLSSIKNLMESMDWSLEQAMDALKLSGEEREKYLSSLTDK